MARRADGLSQQVAADAVGISVRSAQGELQLQVPLGQTASEKRRLKQKP